jgi:hypothetical protein
MPYGTISIGDAKSSEYIMHATHITDYWAGIFAEAVSDISLDEHDFVCDVTNSLLKA